MKLLHLADLHLGRRHDTVDLHDDQSAVLEEILALAAQEHPDGALIAGDVYDRALPPADAVGLLDRFLTRLSAICPVCLISGNHDAGERLAFASSLLARQRVYISGGYDGSIKPVPVGDADVYLLPYLAPAEVRHALGRDDLRTIEDAVRAALATCQPGQGKHRVLLAHLFVTAGGALPETCDSERAPIGGLDSVDFTAFDGFDYVALGHLHGPQRIGRDTVRYAGSPLPYSFSEERQRKSVTIVTLDGDISVQQLPLRSGRRMRTLEGRLETLLAGEPSEDFILARLTDPTPQVDARTRLVRLYPNLLKVTSTALATADAALSAAGVGTRSPQELFDDFYMSKTGVPLTEEQRAVVADFLRQAQEEVE